MDTTLEEIATPVDAMILLEEAEKVANLNDPIAEARAREANGLAVLGANQEAAVVEMESLAAFLDLIYAVDPDYIETQAPAPAPPADLGVEWGDVQQMLSESQNMLTALQSSLSLTLEGMGIPDHQHIRIYEDTNGLIRLVSPHPSKDEIEAELNHPRNKDLQDLHRAAMAGMNLASTLVANSVHSGQYRQQMKGIDAA